MKFIALLLLLLSLLSLSTLAGAQSQDYPDAPSARYPEAWFVLETSTLTAAVVENGRARTSEYYANAREYPAVTTAGRYAAIHSAVYAGTVLGSWKLQHNSRKPIRVLGHAVMWSAITYYAVSYFTR